MRKFGNIDLFLQLELLLLGLVERGSRSSKKSFSSSTDIFRRRCILRIWSSRLTVDDTIHSHEIRNVQLESYFSWNFIFKFAAVITGGASFPTKKYNIDIRKIEFLRPILQGFKNFRARITLWTVLSSLLNFLVFFYFRALGDNE